MEHLFSMTLRSSASSKQVFLFSCLLLWLCSHQHLRLLWRNLAGLVEDAEKDEYENSHHRVTDDGHNRPHWQTHPQLMLHGLSTASGLTVVASQFRSGSELCMRSAGCWLKSTVPPWERKRFYEDSSCTSILYTVNLLSPLVNTAQ